MEGARAQPWKALHGSGCLRRDSLAPEVGQTQGKMEPQQTQEWILSVWEDRP